MRLNAANQIALALPPQKKQRYESDTDGRFKNTVSKTKT